jgi:hypothetical protein
VNKDEVQVLACSGSSVFDPYGILIVPRKHCGLGTRHCICNDNLSGTTGKTTWDGEVYMTDKEYPMGTLEYDVVPWKIYRQDSGMGEHDYAILINDQFFARTEHRQHADEIIRAIRFWAEHTDV